MDLIFLRSVRDVPDEGHFREKVLDVVTRVSVLLIESGTCKSIIRYLQHIYVIVAYRLTGTSVFFPYGVRFEHYRLIEVHALNGSNFSGFHRRIILCLHVPDYELD